MPALHPRRHLCVWRLRVSSGRQLTLAGKPCLLERAVQAYPAGSKLALLNSRPPSLPITSPPFIARPKPLLLQGLLAQAGPGARRVRGVPDQGDGQAGVPRGGGGRGPRIGGALRPGRRGGSTGGPLLPCRALLSGLQSGAVSRGKRLCGCWGEVRCTPAGRPQQWPRHLHLPSRHLRPLPCRSTWWGRGASRWRLCCAASWR